MLYKLSLLAYLKNIITIIIVDERYYLCIQQAHYIKSTYYIAGSAHGQDEPNLAS